MKYSRQSIRTFFTSNRDRGMDLWREMLWGYFFVDPRRRALTPLVPLLEKRGLRYVGMLARPKEDSDALFLHVERVETHSAASLYLRCTELHELAERWGIEGFDGFDGGNVDGSPLLPA